MMTYKFSDDKRMLAYGFQQSYSGIFCFSTTRHGGYSTGEYASFNCNHYCGDEPERVNRNRELLCSLMPVRPDGLIIPHQTHGTQIRQIDHAFLQLPLSEQTIQLEGIDALLTNIPRQCICVSTADCIPVLCFDVRRRVVAPFMPDGAERWSGL